MSSFLPEYNWKNQLYNQGLAWNGVVENDVPLTRVTSHFKEQSLAVLMKPMATKSSQENWPRTSL